MAPCISGLQGSVLGPAFRVTPCHFLRALLQRSYLPYNTHSRGWDRMQDPQLSSQRCCVIWLALPFSRTSPEVWALGGAGGCSGLQQRM